MRGRDFKVIKDAAEAERKLTVDPRHEEPPDGDWPWHDQEPTMMSEALSFALTALGIAAVMLAASALGWFGLQLISLPPF